MTSCNQALVTIQKVIVHKSESYGSIFGTGIGGEPGNSAEWELHFTVAGQGAVQRFDGVRDGSVLTVNRAFLVDLNAIQESLHVEVSGVEVDDSSANDTLPTATYTITPKTNWTEGQTFQSAAPSSQDFAYDFVFDIRCANTGTIGSPLTGSDGKLTITAAWQPEGGGEIQVYDWSYADYRKQYDALWNQGWRLHLLENRVVNNEVRYTAVWRPSTAGEIQVYEWSYTDFRKKYDELWQQGWRLHILNNVVVNGQVRYIAVWRPSTSGEIQVYEWAYADYRKKYDELWNQGWRLHILNNFVVNGQVRYTAVWRPSTAGEIQVYEWAYADYRKQYDELWQQGWRLHILNTFVVNGQTRYTAVWQPSTAGEIQVYEWAYADYRKKYDELWQQGWRLKLINTY
ncbi:MAG: hypothetical protein U0350_46380 [Caldilineaceae bacterium]